ncbi:MAG: YicC family protein [Candidatus Omnitrophica bacterium]|nr:YicC family protein [Candidatus Omnitrophota bacterium]
MIRSMTGFGRSELKFSHGHIRAEVKTTNHKYLEVSSRLPGHLGEYEEAMRRAVAQEVRRGKVLVFVSCPDPSVLASRLALNESLAKELFQKRERLRQVLKLGGRSPEPLPAEAVLREILHYPDVLTRETSYDEKASFSNGLMKAVALALKSLTRSREQEGRALLKDFLGRLSEIQRSVRAIEKRIPAVAGEYKRSLENRMKEFIKDGKIDSERLTLEVALYVKNSDISEEITRLKSHLDGMKIALREGGELGRKIDFIAQEMTRESNTMGAKASDAAIAAEVIKIKSAIEKIREQAQNVE